MSKTTIQQKIDALKNATIPDSVTPTEIANAIEDVKNTMPEIDGTTGKILPEYLPESSQSSSGESVIAYAPTNWTQGYRTSTGSLVTSNASYHHSGLVEINGISKILLKGNIGFATSLYNLVFFAADQSFISAWKAAQNTTDSGWLDVPANARYIDLSNLVTSGLITYTVYTAQIAQYNNSLLIPLNKKVNKIEFPLKKILDSYILTTGKLKALAGYSYYDFVQVQGGKTYYLSGSNLDAGAAVQTVSFYKNKSEDSFISGLMQPKGGIFEDYPITVPVGANYVRLSGLAALDFKLTTDTNGLLDLLISSTDKALLGAPSTTDLIAVPKFLDTVINRENILFLDVIAPANDDVENGLFTVEGFTGATMRKRSIKYMPTGTTANKVVKIKKLTPDLNELAAVTTTVRTIPRTGGTGQEKNICVVGDSLVFNANGANPKELFDLLAADGDYVINQIGTKGTVATALHEGRSGWTWSDYSNPATAAQNAFWNNGALDFQNYMNVNFPSLSRKEIDLMAVCLGTNDIGASPYSLLQDSTIDGIIVKIKVFVDAFFSADKGFPNAKFAMGLVPVGAPYGVEMYGGLWKKRAQTFNARLLKEFDNGIYHPNLTCMIHALGMDRENNYPYVDEAVSEYNPTVLTRRYDNSIHPTSIGYKQFGRGIYNKMRAFLSGQL